MENGEFALLVARTVYLLVKTEITPGEFAEAIRGVDRIKAVPCEFNMSPFLWDLREHRALEGQVHVGDPS